MQIYKADAVAWVFAVGMPTAFGTMFVFATLLSSDPTDKFIGGALALSLVVLGLAWVARFRILLADDSIEFRSLFGGTKRMDAKAIRSVRLAWEIGNGLQGPLRLIIEPKRRTGVSRISINAKVFSRTAVQAVLAFGREVASADDGNLLDGVVLREVRRIRSRKRRAPSN